MTELPQRLPHVSPSRLAMLRRAFGFLQIISPAFAAAVAFRLFLRPIRRKLRDEDARLLAGTRTHWLQAGTDQIKVHEWGSAERTVIVLHGWSSRAARFAPLCGLLADRGWRVLCPDAPGHGASPGSSSSLPQFMATLDALAARFGPPQALIGHSLGALAIACRHTSGLPDWAAKVGATALISMPSGGLFLTRSFEHMLELGSATQAHLLRRYQQRFGCNPDGFEALPGAAHVASPLLLVHDRQDDLIPYSHCNRLLEQLPHAQHLATDGLGHSALTRDATTIATIAQFIETAAVRSSA